MGDERLRELERRWNETGSAVDEANLHLARLRAGITTVARLELAAALGSPAAWRAATTNRSPLPLTAPGDLSPEGLKAYTRLRDRLLEEEYFPVEFGALDREAEGRASLAALVPLFAAWVSDLPGWLGDEDQALPHETYELAASLEQRIRTAIQACEEHCAMPTPEGERRLFEIGASLEGASNALYGQGGGEWQDNWLATCLVGMVDGVSQTCLALASDYSAGPGLVEHVIRSAMSAWVNEDRQEELQERVNQAQRNELLPWLLGHSDPVRERVEARQRGVAGE